MKPKYHGIRYDESKGTWGFHFSILRLLWLFADDRRFLWPDKWSDTKSQQAVTAFHATFNKFDRAAEHFGRCAGILEQHYNAADPEAFSKADSALRDIHIYLDSMFIYLRIQADYLGDVIPYFYGTKGSGSRRLDGFRSHRKWFTKTMPDYDPRYREILLAHTKWFDALAGEGDKGGKGEGLRDIIMHKRGIYELSLTIPDAINEFELHAPLISDAGIVRNNLIPELKEIVLGYFLYLDEALIHFSKLIGANLPDGSVPMSIFSKPYYGFLGQPIPSVWVYPVIEE